LKGVRRKESRWRGIKEEKKIVENEEVGPC
jgi:hypothetical protein